MTAASEPEGLLAEPAVGLLLGGESRRMGRDKSRLELAGEPLVIRLARLAAAHFEELLLVGGDPPPGCPGRPVADPPGPPCALRGIVAALAATTAERVLLLATDLPFASAELLLGLVAFPEADAVVPRDASGLHPLCAIYRREPVLALAREQLAADRLRVGALLERLEVQTLGGADLAAIDPQALALSNVNTPEDWRAALGRAAPPA